jgi:outer membrane protein OmpA-like peptidoglycan-associated protein
MSTNPNDPNRDVHGTSTVQPTGAPAAKKTNWLPWVLGALALLALLFLLSRCGRDDATTATTTTEQTTVDTSAVAVDPAAAPAGVTGETAPAGVAAAGAAATGNVLGQMQAYLASTEAAGRRFTFDNIHFATNSAELPADAATTINGIAQALQAAPNARVRIEGYADARGGAGTNAQLGAQRAEAVARALIGAGVAANRVETATGGETNPVDTNATVQGQADNRRTDLVVTSK